MLNPATHLFTRLWTFLALCLTLLAWLAYDSAAASAAVPPQEAPARPAAQNEAEWTIMLYQDADDEILERDIMIDFNEAERVGSTDQVNIVAQVDRYIGAFDGMGDWTSTKRFYLTQNDNLDEIGSEELADLGEVNMADGPTLVDFITWAVANFPARKYALIMSDHGAGWPGGFGDPDPGGLGADDLFLTQGFGDQLYLMEIDRSLEAARAQAGIDQFEFVGFDACLMAQLEVFNALAPHARYSVASQETEPALGWAYTSFLTELTNNPAMDGAELGQHIVDSYIDQDQRIVDDAARQAFVAEAYGFEGQATPQEVAEVSGTDITLTAVDLAGIPAVNAALDKLAASLVNIDPGVVAQARAYAQAFTTIFGDESPSPYIDLANFAQLAVQLSGDARVSAAADELNAALGQAIVAEKSGPERPGAAGVAIHFPTSELFGVGDNFGYAQVASRFAAETKWDEFLNFHYVGTQGEIVAAPVDLEEAYGGLVTSGEQLNQAQQQAASVKPLQMAPLSLSAEVAAIGQAVNLTSEVSGDRLAYIYTFIGRILPNEEVLIVEDLDYIFADQNNEVDGVVYPVWPEGSVSVDYVWEPYIYAISDGTHSVRALLSPDTYDAESPTYSADGIYTFAGSGEQRAATLYFRDGELTKVFGFTGADVSGGGSPREITPRPGDQFTVLEQGYNLSETAESEDFSRPGGTLTFGAEPFFVEDIPAPAGSYILGFIAEDVDGQTQAQYEGLFVENSEASAVEGFRSYASEELGFALLYPDVWLDPEEDLPGGRVTFSSADDSAFAVIYKESYPDAAGTQQANEQAIQSNVDFLNQLEGLENLQYVGETNDIIVGAFAGRELDFTYEQDGQPQSGFIVVTTPTPDVTYSILMVAADADLDNAVTNFNTMLENFDILISGVSKEEIGAALPALAESAVDDFTDPASGLVDAQEARDWGRGYYASDIEQYVMELNPYAGPIYDYYEGATLGDNFLLQVTTSYEGAQNNSYGLIFRQSENGYYAFSISGDGFYTVKRADGEEASTLIDWTASELIDQNELGANVLAVLGQGDTYNLYINGRQVNTFTDAAHSGGTIGIIANNFDEENPVTFYYDDLTIGTPATE
jgi:hypothetical protein